MKDYDCFVFVGIGKPPNWLCPDSSYRTFPTKWVDVLTLEVYGYAGVWHHVSYLDCVAKAIREIKKVVDIMGY